ncbi:MAG: Na+/H+ antiporter NhaC family protein [Muribaculaceae bacterium]|nr:Na+/H+ antiporter NhaC family protein [Muribaculaceae bacterium]MDE6332981.1 Na+/H+ antiporter NhaC family protein [Muribaculaceae bacterium]
MPEISIRRGLLGISPVIVFLLLYVVVSIAVGDFYKMPFTVALLAASVWAIAVYKGPLAERIEVFSRAAGHSNIIYMIWIFILAGAFAAVAKEIGAVNATVDLTLRVLPAQLVVPGIFVAACFISLAVGTSVGTVVALTPLATEIARSSGGDTAFLVAVVLGGAFFGDNLSFISDTTIAATRTQGCDMADKFRANVWLAVPAAIVTLVFYMFESPGFIRPETSGSTASPWLVLPYLVVIATAIARVNVSIVLSLGIVTSLIIGFVSGYPVLELCGYMGGGIDGMGGLIVITLMSAGMLGVVKASGGITWLLQVLTARVKGARGAQMCIAVLVSLVNLCTANNTVAIITVGSLAREIATRFGISARKSASLLDTCSCIVQCIIPYGAQTLLACSLSGLSPAEPFAYLYYPWALAVVVIMSILFVRK